jgi:drug/metabolite transporter (DMT)-like permease
MFILLSWLVSSGRHRAITGWSWKQWAGMAAAAATGVFAYSVFFMLGLQHVQASRASLVVTINPVLTLLLAAWLMREPLNKMIVLGMLLAAAGALYVITKGMPLQILDGSLGRGEVLLLGCVVSWVSYTLISRSLLQDIDAVTTTAMTATLGCVMLLLASLTWDSGLAIAAAQDMPAKAWVALLFLSIGATSLGYAWYFDGMKVLGAGAAAGYMPLVPVFGVLFSALVLNETLDWSILVGGLMAVTGTAIMNFARR